MFIFLYRICIEFLYVYFPVLLCLSVSVKWLAVKTASEMTYCVSGGALNSTHLLTHLFINLEFANFVPIFYSACWQFCRYNFSTKKAARKNAQTENDQQINNTKLWLLDHWSGIIFGERRTTLQMMWNWNNHPEKPEAKAVQNLNTRFRRLV